MNIKTAFFDFDGTIFDSEKIYQHFWKEAICSFSLDPKRANFLLLRSLDRNLTNLYLQERYPSIDPNLLRERRIALMDDWKKSHHFSLKEGAKEGLYRFYQQNIALYVVSSSKKETIREMLFEVGLLPIFKDVISTKETKRGKPFPDCYQLALNVSHADPFTSLAFEDAPSGAIAAIKANIPTIFIPDLTLPPRGLLPLLKGVYPSLKQASQIIKGY